MLRKALTTAALVLFGAAALAATPAAPALSTPAACGGDPALSAVFAPDAAPAFTPLVQPAQLQAATCTDCTFERGCFPCGSAGNKAPCVISTCCGVVTRGCGSCTNHCIPPPA